MGNAVSAAELAASQIINPNTPLPDYKKFEQEYYSSKDVPPECPIHRKAAPPSECPIHSDNSGNEEINPFNMVTKILNVFILFMFCLLSFKDASW